MTTLFRQHWFAVLAALLIVPCCALAAEPAKTVIVFVDLSDSTRTHRDDYKRYFHMILDATGEGDRLIIGSIEKSPKGKSITRFNEELPIRNALLDNEIKFNARTRKILDAAQEAFSSLVSEESNETPIIDTIDEATRLFANFDKPRKVLVFFSDMKEFTKGGVNFEARNFDLSEKKADQLLADLRGKKRIPDLSGVKIYVAGARDDNAKLQGQVKDFWAKYFKEAKADFSAERYGTDLVAFPECPECKRRYSKLPAK